MSTVNDILRCLVFKFDKLSDNLCAENMHLHGSIIQGICAENMHLHGSIIQGSRYS